MPINNFIESLLLAIYQFVVYRSNDLNSGIRQSDAFAKRMR